MGIIDVIYGYSRRRRDRRNLNRQIQQIEDNNANYRNVVNYHDSPIESFVNRYQHHNMILSGNNNTLRSRLNCAVAWNCHVSRRGAVIIHAGNTELEDMLNTTFSGENNVHIINSGNRRYDPFVDLDKYALAQFILSSSGTNYRIERMGGSYLYGLTDYLNLMRRPICINSFLDCLNQRLYDQVLDEMSRGRINSMDGGRINSQLAQGQMELGNIEQYFNILNQQGNNVLVAENNIQNALSIKKVLRQNGIIVIDINNALNGLLLNVIAEEIKQSMSMGLSFSLIMDSIPLNSSEILGMSLRTFSGSCKYTLTSNDIYADTESTANIFDTLIGRADKVFVLQHYAGPASVKFSEFFGQYLKQEIQQSYNRTNEYHRYGQFLPGQNTGTNISIQSINRPRIEANDITGQSRNHMYVKLNGQNDIISVNVIAGSAREDYNFPTRRNVQTERTVRFNMGINWILFFLLLIVFPPAAFIYSFFKTNIFGKILSVIFFIFVLGIIISNMNT